MVRQVKAPAPKPVDPSSAPDSPQRGRREAVSCLLISTSTPGHVCSHTPEDTQNKNINVIFFKKRSILKQKGRRKKGIVSADSILEESSGKGLVMTFSWKMTQGFSPKTQAQMNSLDCVSKHWQTQTNFAFQVE